MNRISHYIMSICLLIGLAYSCSDDKISPLPKPVPLEVTLASKSLVMGDVLKMEISVDNPNNEALVTNEELDIYLSAKTGLNDISDKIFDNFPKMVTFPKGERKIEIEIPVKKEGISSTSSVDIAAFARGYKVKNSSQTIIVSDYYYTIVELKDNPDKEVLEGETFVITANVAVDVTENLIISIQPKEGEEDNYENLPSELVIKAGKKSVESESVTLKKDGVFTGDKKLTLLLSANSEAHPLSVKEFDILKKDIDTPLGSFLGDERWLYDNPNIPFTSDKNKNAVINWYGDDVKLMKMGDPHPKKAAWNFYNAIEFHRVSGLTNSNTPNAHGNFLPKGLAAQNTAATQQHMAVVNDKYSTVTNDGYLRMWAVKEPNVATGGGAGPKDYGVSAFYCSKFGDATAQWAQHHTRIYPGMRVETRARIRGEKHGFNCAIWLQGNAQSKLQWPIYGEIDILENPVGPKTGKDKAFQTFHIGDNAAGSYYNPSVSHEMVNMSDWNIYWVELIDENTVAMGINGQTNITLQRENLPAGAQWPFNKILNPEGFHYLLTMGGPSSWGLGSTIPNGWDSGFANIGFEESKTNTSIPRMEIDWIRYYTNDKYDIGDRTSQYTHNGLFLF